MKNGVSTKEDVLRILESCSKEIEEYGVRKIGVFGSFVRDKAREESDLDLLVEFSPGQKTFRRFMRLAFFLEDLFQRKVDLVTVEGLSPYLKPSIVKEVEYVQAHT